VGDSSECDTLSDRCHDPPDKVSIDDHSNVWIHTDVFLGWVEIVGQAPFIFLSCHRSVSSGSRGLSGLGSATQKLQPSSVELTNVGTNSVSAAQSLTGTQHELQRELQEGVQNYQETRIYTGCLEDRRSRIEDEG
jgi:hypothetical protein